LNAETILVTGLSNAKKTALYARQLASIKSNSTINIIASHAGDDDDLACAEYIRDVLLGLNQIQLDRIQSRIKVSRPAQKFFDPVQEKFDVRDMDYCTQEIDSDFVMVVDKSQSVPRIVKKNVL